MVALLSGRGRAKAKGNKPVWLEARGGLETNSGLGDDTSQTSRDFTAQGVQDWVQLQG